MGAPLGRDGAIRPTDLWLDLEAKVEQYKPRLLVLDNLADVFGGNEISRSETRQFVGMLRSLAIRHSLAVVLLAHPSLAGMTNGSGISGSTAWNGSVRSRLYFQSIKDKDGTEPDATQRILKTMKANYGPTGGEIRLRWERGCFRLDAPIGDRATSAAVAEAVFLDLLAEFSRQGRDVSPNRSNSFAPTVFAKNPASKGCKGSALEKAMETLLKSNRIAIDHFGPPSKRRQRLVLVSPETCSDPLPTPSEGLPTPVGGVQ